MAQSKVSRRKFLQSAASAAGLVAAPMFIPSTVLGKDGGVAPSNRLTMAHIGVGGQGSYHLRIHSGRKDVQVVSVCDVDRRHLDKAKNTLAAAYGNANGISFMQDFREMLQDKDKFDAVLIAIPDHNHAIAALACLRAGKDVYCEKPLTRAIAEGRRISDTVNQLGRVFQTGSHERSNPKSRYVADLVQNGYLGDVKRIEVSMPVTSHGPIPIQKPMDPPAELDYDLWLGPAPYEPYFYCEEKSPVLHKNYERCHFWFRYILDYATGEMSDRGAHILDLCQMILGKDKTGPTEVDARGVQFLDSAFDTFMEYEFDIKYADGCVIHGSSKGDDDTRGLKVIGDKGWINVHVHGCALTASDPKLLDIKLKPSDKTIGRVVSHHDNFYEAIKTRGETVAPAETGHRTATICHIATLGMQLNRPLKWDPDKEMFIGDDEANRQLSYEYRAPWVL